MHRPIFALVFVLSVGCDSPAKSDAVPPSGASAKPLADPGKPPAPKKVASKPAQAMGKTPNAPSAADCPAAPEVKFFDAALEAEVRKKLQKPDAKITRADLKKVRSVNLVRSRVDYLDPCVFPLLTNLRQLYVGRGNVSDLRPIAGLIRLDGLRLSLTKVSDIRPLAGMTKMDRLDLGRTQVSDLTPLAKLTALTELELDDTAVAEIKPLVGLTKLKRLSLKNTRVKDLNPLLSLTSLKYLNVEGTPVENTFGLAPLRKKGLKVLED